MGMTGGIVRVYCDRDGERMTLGNPNEWVCLRCGATKPFGGPVIRPGQTLVSSTPASPEVPADEHSPCHNCGHQMRRSGSYHWRCTNPRCRPREIEPTEVPALDLDERTDEPEPPPDQSLAMAVWLLLVFATGTVVTFYVVSWLRNRLGFYF